MEMQTFLKGRRVGYWLSEKKMKKLNFQAFADLCRYVAKVPNLSRVGQMMLESTNILTHHVNNMFLLIHFSLFMPQ